MITTFKLNRFHFFVLIYLLLLVVTFVSLYLLLGFYYGIFTLLFLLSVTYMFAYYCNKESILWNKIRNIKGDFLNTHTGTIRYEYKTGELGTILFINGFPFSYEIWDNNFYIFNQLGYSVVRYDFWGIGFSQPIKKKRI